MSASDKLTEPAVLIHLTAAIVAIVLGAVILWRRKGGRWHRLGGRVWVATMVVVSVSAFGIHHIRTFGPFSPLHLLSLVTLVSLALGLWFIRHRNVEGHRATLRILYGAALLIPGAFTLLPDRLLGRLLFPDGMAWTNYAVMILTIGAGLWTIVQARRRPLAGESFAPRG